MEVCVIYIYVIGWESLFSFIPLLSIFTLRLFILVVISFFFFLSYHIDERMIYNRNKSRKEKITEITARCLSFSFSRCSFLLIFLLTPSQLGLYFLLPSRITNRNSEGVSHLNSRGELKQAFAIVKKVFGAKTILRLLIYHYLEFRKKQNFSWYHLFHDLPFQFFTPLFWPYSFYFIALQCIIATAAFNFCKLLHLFNKKFSF